VTLRGSAAGLAEILGVSPRTRAEAQRARWVDMPRCPVHDVRHRTGEVCDRRTREEYLAQRWEGIPVCPVHDRRHRSGAICTPRPINKGGRPKKIVDPSAPPAKAKVKRPRRAPLPRELCQPRGGNFSASSLLARLAEAC